MAKSPEEQAAAMIAALPEKTGRSLEQWTALVAESGLAKHGQIVGMLKSDHGVTHGYANLIAHKALASDAGSASSQDDLVEAQYSGAKAGLRPIYERLVAAVGELGKDAELAPKKSYVSLRRSKQFGLIQPSTKTRVDLGLNLGGATPKGRLEASGSFNSMVSHRVRLSSAAEVDAELVGWLKRAYEQA